MLEGLTYGEPHGFVREGYDKYTSNYPSKPSLNGRIFEFLICETLVRDDLVPFYYQARFVQVANADFDIVLYHPKKPVVLSAKTSLRERYKQADLEGLALKQVYRGAECYLLTLSDEHGSVQQKIEDGDVSGLSACLRADTPYYDALLQELKSSRFQLVEMIAPLIGKPVQTT